MPQGNPIYNKRLSKFLPEDGCIRQGWEDDTDYMPKVSLPIWGGEFWWSLGTPERFRVAIHYGYDRKEQSAKAIAVLFWKNAKGKFEVVDTLPVHSANDILEVATTFDDRFAKEDSEISRQWKESMSRLYEEINAADNELQRTYATGDWGDWETSWDCADFDADEDATFLQDVVEIWRFMDIDDSTPWETLKAYIRFQRGRSMFRAVTRDVIGEDCDEDEARLNRVLEICQRKFNRTKSLKTKANILDTEQLLLPELYERGIEPEFSTIQKARSKQETSLTEGLLAKADNLSSEAAYIFSRTLLETVSNDDTKLDKWYDKMRTRMMRTEDLNDLLALTALLYEIEFYRRQSQTITDHYVTSRLEDRCWVSDEEDW